MVGESQNNPTTNRCGGISRRSKGIRFWQVLHNAQLLGFKYLPRMVIKLVIVYQSHVGCKSLPSVPLRLTFSPSKKKSSILRRDCGNGR